MIPELVVASSPKEVYAKDLYARAKKLGLTEKVIPGLGATYFIKLGNDLGDGRSEYLVSVRLIANGDKLGGQVTTQFFKLDRFTGRVVSGAPVDQDNIFEPVDAVIADVAERIRKIRKITG